MTTEADLRRAELLLLLEAALQPDLWPEALEAIACACRAEIGQIIANDPADGIALNVVAGISCEQIDTLHAYRGLTDPADNPRLRLGRAAPVMAPVADQDYLDAELRREYPIYAELYEPLGALFNCQAVLLRGGDLMLRTSVTRSTPLEDAERRAFAALLPHIQAAVRTQRALESAQGRAGARLLDALASPALLLDRRGQVIAMSEAAEREIAAGRLLKRSERRIDAVLRDDAPALRAALDRALAADEAQAGAAAPLVLRDRSGADAFALEIRPLPNDGYMVGGAPAVLIVARPAAALRSRAELAMAKWGLGRAEAHVASLMAGGLSIPEIADARGVSVATVQSQLRTSYAKMDVHRQAELVAAVLALGGAQDGGAGAGRALTPS